LCPNFDKQFVKPMPNFKDRLNKLANRHLESQSAREKDAESALKRMRQREVDSKKRFAELRKDVFVPMVRDAEEEFKSSGAHFAFFSEQEATALADQIRTFFQVLYYPKGRSRLNVGINTPSLLFECVPAHGKVRVRQNTSIRPAPMVDVKEVSVDELDAEGVQSVFAEFIQQVIEKY